MRLRDEGCSRGCCHWAHYMPCELHTAAVLGWDRLKLCASIAGSASTGQQSPDNGMQCFITATGPLGQPQIPSRWQRLIPCVEPVQSGHRSAVEYLQRMMLCSSKLAKVGSSSSEGTAQQGSALSTQAIKPFLPTLPIVAHISSRLARLRSGEVDPQSTILNP